MKSGRPSKVVSVPEVTLPPMPETFRVFFDEDDGILNANVSLGLTVSMPLPEHLAQIKEVMRFAMWQAICLGVAAGE